MTSLKTLLRSRIFFGLFVLALNYGCTEEPQSKKYIARVNDSYLTEEDLNGFDSLTRGGFSRKELINDWVEREILYQEAVKFGILDDADFKRIIKDSERELASAMLIQQYFESNLKKPGTSDLKTFYSEHENEFFAKQNIYVFSSASFSNENIAIRFRTKAVQTSWQNAIEFYLDEKSFLAHANNTAAYRDGIYPVELLRLLDELNTGEISIVLEENPDRFTVVQFLQKFKTGMTAPFEVISDEVETRYLANERERMREKFLEELYSDNKIEIKEK